MEKLRKLIIGKFGTVSEFCRLSGISRSKIEYFLSLPKPFTMRQKSFEKKIYKAINSMKPVPYEVTKQEREKLSEVIIKDYNGNVKLFSDIHNFDRTTVHQTISGFRKRKTKLVMEVLNAANL